MGESALLESPVDQEHLRLLRLGFLVSAAITASYATFGLLYLLMGLVFGMLAYLGVADEWFMGVFFGLFGGALGVGLGIVAALKVRAAACLKKRTSRRFCQVVAAISCLEIPYGTALGIVALLVLDRASVKAAFAAGAGAGAGAPAPASTADADEPLLSHRMRRWLGRLATAAALTLFAAVTLLVSRASAAKDEVTGIRARLTAPQLRNVGCDPVKATMSGASVWSLLLRKSLPKDDTAFTIACTAVPDAPPPPCDDVARAYIDATVCHHERFAVKVTRDDGFDFTCWKNYSETGAPLGVVERPRRCHGSRPEGP